jgi:hypothetical protein
MLRNIEWRWHDEPPGNAQQGIAGEIVLKQIHEETKSASEGNEDGYVIIMKCPTRAGDICPCIGQLAFFFRDSSGLQPVGTHFHRDFLASLGDDELNNQYSPSLQLPCPSRSCFHSIDAFFVWHVWLVSSSKSLLGLGYNLVRTLVTI